MIDITSKEYSAICYLWARIGYYINYNKDPKYIADTLPQDKAASDVVEGLIDRVNAWIEQKNKEEQEDGNGND